MSSIKQVIQKPKLSKRARTVHQLIRNAGKRKEVRVFDIARLLTGDDNAHETINERDEEGYTALMLAAEQGNMSAVRALIANRAVDDFDGIDYEEHPEMLGYASSALEIAMSTDQEMAEYISRQASTSGVIIAYNSQATHDLHAAINKRNVEAAKKAIAAGAKVDARCNFSPQQDTALTWSVRQFIPEEIFQAVLDAGADPNLPNGDGMTPLLSAVANGTYKERIIALLERGARDEPDKKGLKPSDCARRHHDFMREKLITEWKPQGAGEETEAKTEEKSE